MTREEEHNNMVDPAMEEKDNALNKYRNLRRQHNNILKNLKATKDWIKKCEKNGWGDTEPRRKELFPDYTFDMEHHENLVESFTKDFVVATKLKLLAIQKVRDNGYLEQNQIEY